MIFIIKHIIALIALITASALYGYSSAIASSDWLAALLACLYSCILILIYIYTYDATPKLSKLFGVLFTLVSCTAGLYLAWAVWTTIRSDYQLYLFSEPHELWKEIMSMASNNNNKLVHLRYPALDPGSTKLYIFWILEAATTILIPSLFSIRSITGYSDAAISAEEIHKEFSLTD